MSTGQTTLGKPPAPRKHLMTPGSPRPRRQEPMDVGRVQRWVLSTLAAVTISHMSAGLVLAAIFADRASSQIGLLVIAGAFGFFAALAALVIHQHRLVSPWLLLGATPQSRGRPFHLGLTMKRAQVAEIGRPRAIFGSFRGHLLRNVSRTVEPR